MTRRATFFLGAVLAGLVMLAGPARAQSSASSANDDNYTALCSPLAVSSSSINPGDTVTVSGTAATAGATIVIVLNDTTELATTTSAADRTFSTSVTIPANTPPGNVQLQAFQLGDKTDPIVGCPSQVAGLEILAPVPGEQPLARTGTNSTLPLTRLGFGLVAAGGLVILVSRRRKATAEA